MGGKYNVKELKKQADKSAKKYNDKNGWKVSCSLAEGDQSVKSSTHVTFQWDADGHKFQKSSKVTVRCDDACRRGIPLPDGWSTAFKYDEVLKNIEEAEKEVHGRQVALNVFCELRGVPTVD